MSKETQQVQEPRAVSDPEARLAGYSTYHVSPDEALELFEVARQHCPVAHSDQLGGFEMVVEYEDVRQVMDDWATFNSSPSVVRPLAERPQFPPIEFDPPLHHEWRALMQAAFNADTPAKVEGAVRADVVDHIAAFADRGECDLIAELAEPIALLTLCRVLGFDAEKRREVRRLTIEMHGQAGDAESQTAAFMALTNFGAQEAMRRREEPQDDYLTKLANAEIDGKLLGPLELGTAMNSLLNAGHETTMYGIGSLFYEVLSRPDIRAALIDDPELIPAAVEETIRIHTPSWGLFRLVTRDVEVGGKLLPKGTSVLACWAAANRDPDVYENPQEFRLDRKFGRRNRHMGFGHGNHACIGAPTARMEMRVCLEELLSRLPEIELADPDGVKYEFSGMEIGGINVLPARWEVG